MRTVFLVVLYVFLVLIIAPVLLLCAVVGLRAPIMAYGKWAMRMSRGILGIRVLVSGLENTPTGTPCIFMPNHLSLLDGPLLVMILPGSVRVILKKSVFRLPVVGQGMLFVGFVPVDRKGVRGGRKSLDRAARLMREKGYSFLIFPEGTRSRDGGLQPFRRGGFFLALESGASIVPITIKGTFELMPRGQWRPRKGEVRVTIHPPVSVAGFSRDRIRELMDVVRQAIAGGG